MRDADSINRRASRKSNYFKLTHYPKSDSVKSVTTFLQRK